VDTKSWQTLFECKVLDINQWAACSEYWRGSWDRRTACPFTASAAAARGPGRSRRSDSWCASWAWRATCPCSATRPASSPASAATWCASSACCPTTTSRSTRSAAAWNRSAGRREARASAAPPGRAGRQV